MNSMMQFGFHNPHHQHHSFEILRSDIKSENGILCSYSFVILSRALINIRGGKKTNILNRQTAWSSANWLIFNPLFSFLLQFSAADDRKIHLTIFNLIWEKLEIVIFKHFNVKNAILCQVDNNAVNLQEALLIKYN